MKESIFTRTLCFGVLCESSTEHPPNQLKKDSLRTVFVRVRVIHLTNEKEKKKNRNDFLFFELRKES